MLDAPLVSVVETSTSIVVHQVHIDAHSDDAPPEMRPNFPWFQWPQAPEQLRALMQGNDQFIIVSPWLLKLSVFGNNFVVSGSSLLAGPV